jgi:Zn ribbon nucleic-acid-binding protein
LSPKEPIYQEQYNAVNAMRTCRTEALGVDYYSCADCGHITKVYHSCKNRFCPTCSWQDTLKWAERIKNNMMDLPHRHTVMTLPHQLNDLIKNNKNELLSALLRSAADTLKDWIEHKYNLKPGIISVLHTYGETKDYHVHAHMIVSWGGIDIKTSALKQIKGEFVNYDFLKKKVSVQV